MTHNTIRAGLYGLCVADALGVPAESRTRDDLKKNPITGMVGGGLHGQPAGYWSDDSIPAQWTEALANRELIDACIKGMEEYINGL